MNPLESVLAEVDGLSPSRDGFYRSDGWHMDFPKLQMLTVGDLLNGKQVQLPPSLHTCRQVERSETASDNQTALKFE